MSFLLRASVVIGLLAFLASEHDKAGRHAAKGDLAALAGFGLSKLEGAIPAETKDRLVSAGLQEAARHLPAARPSADTLSELDRRLPWRGFAAR